MKYKFRRRFLYTLLRFITTILYPIPLAIMRPVGKWLGALGFCLAGKHRRQTIANLKQAFGKKTSAEIRAIARGVFENIGQTFAELINFPKINAKNIDRYVKAYGMGKVDEALLKGKGVIGLTAHLGNWELLAAHLALKGYPVSTIARPLRYHKYDELINNLRRSKGLNVILRGNAFKRALKALKENHILGILPDQDIDSIDGVFVEFFGKKAYTSIGPVALAMASGAVLLPIYIVREGRKHKTYVDDPIELELTGDRQKDYITNTAKWTKVLENYIRRYPAQWVWMHRRWKTQHESTRDTEPN